jgi:hypothetical protein
MDALLWLGGALITAVAAYLVGWPAWTSYRSREERDLNADRYHAWRGRARRPSATTSEGMTGIERRRLWIAGGLAVAAAFCLVAFFTVS